jgi:alpha-amylase
MSSVCLYFQVHQPRRVKRYSVFDVGYNSNYFDGTAGNLDNRAVLHKVAHKSYLPTNAVLLDLLNRYREFKVSFSLSGVVLEQFAESMPEVIESFRRLADTGRVEFLGETYYHSLAFLHSEKEFGKQIKLHDTLIRDTFEQWPSVFRNTELIYRNDLAKVISGLGYSGMLAEGADHILGWRSPNFVYEAVGVPQLKLLLKNYRLSDDIAFRFSEQSWSEWPLTAPKFGRWVSEVNGNGDVVNLFMDYETFGEHQWEDTGIFNFLRSLPEEILRHPDNDFVTPSEAVAKYPSRDTYDAHDYVSWADIERDLSAWRSNAMQYDALRALYTLEDAVLKTGDSVLIDDWRKLTTSDHFYYMCTKWFADGDVHTYFSPYDSPYEAFTAYMNVLADVASRVELAQGKMGWLSRMKQLLPKKLAFNY